MNHQHIQLHPSRMLHSVSNGGSIGITHRRAKLLTAFTLLLTSLPAAHSLADHHEPALNFRIIPLAVDLNEGCDITDVNNDGQPDLIAGRNWYPAPHFTPRPLRAIEDWNGYVHSNGEFAHDVDGDGWVDVISQPFMLTELNWYKNPGPEGLAKGHMWETHLLADTGDLENEGALFTDINGDGTPEYLVNSWNDDRPVKAWELTKDGDGNPIAVARIIGNQKHGHGIGVGDLSGDGLPDVFVENGWYERPTGTDASNAFAQPWKFHPNWQIHASLPIIVRDLDADGRNDLIVGNGHDFGLYWWRNAGRNEDGTLQLEKHVIDESFSQPHCLLMADLDGDGTDELITGKRVWAHNGGDPGGNEPACIYYWKWNPDTQTFTRYTINEGLVGTGLQIRTADLNNDGRLDIAVAGKSGTFILINQGTDNTPN